MSASPRRPLIRTLPAAEGAQLPVSLLGKAFTVRGTLDTDGEVHVYGNVLGRINADVLVVGYDGYVEGDVVVRDARIAGRLNGRLFAFNVTLDSSADITGRIFHHTAEVAKGARVEGRMPWRPLNYFQTLEQLPENRP